MSFSQKGASSTVFIITSVIIIFAASFLYLIIFHKMPANPSAPVNSPQSTALQTYTNSKYGFSVKYPSSFAVREFPDTKDGAGFRPANTPEDPVNEVITISTLQKNADMVNDPLADYAKVAASIQIQNYEKLNSIDPVITDSNVTGYKTTWLVTPLAVLGATTSGTPKVSEPITYFPLPSPNESYTVQVTLNDPAYLSEYNEMIKTYSE